MITMYHSKITWIGDAKQFTTESNGVRYAPIIKCPALSSADMSDWRVLVSDIISNERGVFVDFHFLSPDAPPVISKNDTFTFWDGIHPVAEGVILSIDEMR